MCDHVCPCRPFGPSPEERERQLDEHWAAQQRIFEAVLADPKVQAQIERNLRRIGWRPTPPENTCA